MLKVPTIQGTIRRRLLVNFRADASAVRRLLPAPFKPKLHAGHAIIGICLIRLENIRPRWLPLPWGLSSENAAHRIAAEWPAAGGMEEGVYIARRDSSSWLNHIAGGRIFPGAHHLARFQVTDRQGQIALHMQAKEGDVRLDVVANESEALPPNSCFANLEESSRFFEGGSVGWSPGHMASSLDGLRLETFRWQVQPLAVETARSSWFASHLPAGSFEFDHALLMRDIPHEWHQQPLMKLTPQAQACCGGVCG